MDSDKSAKQPLGCQITLAFMFVAVVVIGVFMWTDSRRGLTVGRIEESIAAEIPKNADRQTVDAWFDGHNISHEYWPGPVDDMEGNETIAEIAGFKNED